MVDTAEAVVSDDVVLDAKVVAMFPPRPEAIMTLLHSDAFLPGTQTLLYSLKVSELRKEHGIVSFVEDATSTHNMGSF